MAITPPPSSRLWPAIGEMQVKFTLQYATPVTDTMGGRREPTWTDFGQWFTKVTVVPIVPNETDAVVLYEVEGQFRGDLLDRFMSGVGIRLRRTGQTLKVFQLENPYLRNRTLVAHCATATNTQ